MADTGYSYNSQFRDGVTELAWQMTPAIHLKTRYPVKLDDKVKSPSCKATCG